MAIAAPTSALMVPICAFTVAAAPLIMAKATIRDGSTERPEIGKFFTARWV